MPKHQQAHPEAVRAVEIAPDIKLRATPAKDVPAFAVMTWKTKSLTDPETGRPVKAFLPFDRIHQGFVRVSDAQKMPLALSRKVIESLVAGGFVAGCTPAPRTMLVSVESLLQHYDQCAQDVDFWARADHLERYRLGASLRRQTSRSGEAVVMEANHDQGLLVLRLRNGQKLNLPLAAITGDASATCELRPGMAVKIDVTPLVRN